MKARAASTRTSLAAAAPSPAGCSSGCRRRSAISASQDADSFHRAVNRVHPGHIRTEADEVQYNLHVMLRFDLEKALIAGDLDTRGRSGSRVERPLCRRFRISGRSRLERGVAGRALVGGPVRLFPDLCAWQCLCGMALPGDARRGAGSGGQPVARRSARRDRLVAVAGAVPWRAYTPAEVIARDAAGPAAGPLLDYPRKSSPTVRAGRAGRGARGDCGAARGLAGLRADRPAQSASAAFTPVIPDVLPDMSLSRLENIARTAWWSRAPSASAPRSILDRTTRG